MTYNRFLIDIFDQNPKRKKVEVKLNTNKNELSSSFEENDYLGDCACSIEDNHSQILNQKNNKAKNTPKIFISYAREDEKIVKQICDELAKAGYVPWIDLEELLPGVDWESEIIKALKNYDFVLICLSNNSIIKKGIVQKEWSAAIEISKEYPYGSVFLIPLRLEYCEIPGNLNKFQCLDYFIPGWLERLSATIDKELQRREKINDKKAKQQNGKNKKMEIEFINREHELDEIRNPGGPQLMGIDAPPGYGKSRLLDEVENWYKKDKKNDWICVRINMNSNVNEFSTNPSLVLNEIAKSIGTISNQIKNPQEIIGKLINHGKNIILLFDSIESNPIAISWMQENFIPLLLSKIKLTRLLCRVIFAGRYIQNPTREWQGKPVEWNWTNYKIMKLTVLDFNIVRQAISKELEKSFLRETQQEVLTNEITYLSGGHPGIIEEMFHNPPNGSWALAFHENILNPETRKNLFISFSKPVIDKILSEIKDKYLIDLLKLLSVFRRFNFNTIRELKKIETKKIYSKNIQEKMNGIIGDSDVQDLIKSLSNIKDDAMVVLTNLVNTGLVSAPTSAMPYYHDAIIRKLILIQLQIEENSGRYFKLHALAHAIYETWLENKSVDGRKLSQPLADQMQADFIAESLYHLLNCLNKDQHSHNEKLIESKIISYAKILRSSFDTPKSILQDNLKSILKQDDDIPGLMRELLGEDGANRMFALLE